MNAIGLPATSGALRQPYAAAANAATAKPAALRRLALPFTRRIPCLFLRARSRTGVVGGASPWPAEPRARADISNEPRRARRCAEEVCHVDRLERFRRHDACLRAAAAPHRSCVR